MEHYFKVLLHTHLINKNKKNEFIFTGCIQVSACEIKYVFFSVPHLMFYSFLMSILLTYYDCIVFKGALGQLFCACLCWSEASGVPRAGNGVSRGPALSAALLRAAV